MEQRENERKSVIQNIGNEKVEVIFKKSLDPATQPMFYWPVNHQITVEDGIVIERDVAIKMRDGITIYADVFRPEGEKKVPAILAWSGPGKNYSFHAKGGIPGIIDKDTLSPWCKQESQDPAYWCHYGYAVINTDSRGVGNSEGDFNFFSDIENEDSCETISWIATQEWCNGKVAMIGTAFPGVSTWFAAAKRPPALACIAPEATYDVYRSIIMRGGVFDAEMMGHVMSRFYGNGYYEDIVSMATNNPLMNAYWQEKIADVEAIDIPVFVHANTNIFHSGNMEGFQRLKTTKKWLKTDNGITWRDPYFYETLEETRRFFDRYLKNIHNGWEFTPQVRLAIYDKPGFDIIDRVEAEWPPARAEHKKLFLDITKSTMSFDAPNEAANVSYHAGTKGENIFTIKFDEDIELLGYGKLRLWVEAKGADDMNVFVALSKLDTNGKPVPLQWHHQIHGGSSGVLRVSHRELDKERSTDSQPVQSHQRELKLNPGEIVPIDIPLFPFGFKFHAGEQLCLTISDEMKRRKSVAMDSVNLETENKGVHVFHAGGEYDSYLYIPTTPIL